LSEDIQIINPTRQVADNITVSDASKMDLTINLFVKDLVKVNEKIKNIRHDHIFIPVLFSPEIEIPLQLSLTQDDIFYLESFKKDSKVERRQLIGRYYFAMRYSATEISKILGISDVAVCNHVKRIKQILVGKIKRDLRVNKKILGHMAELMMQINERVKIMWDKYYQLEEDAVLLRRSVRDISETLRSDPLVALDAARSINGMMAKVFGIHKEQQAYLNLLRQETTQLLQVWEKFGLTGEDAVNVIMSGSVNIDVTIEQQRLNIVRMIGIIKSEVKEQSSKDRVFKRMAKELKFKDMKRVN